MRLEEVDQFARIFNKLRLNVVSAPRRVVAVEIT